MRSPWLLLLVTLSVPAGVREDAAFEKCTVAGSATALAELPEASGVAISRSVSGRLWTHNDSGQPVLFALDTSGKVVGRVELSGVTLDDWEAVAVGPCPTGSCVYVGDIGDNRARRSHIVVYRFPEPKGSDTKVEVKDALRATYPNGPQDAEALLVTPDGHLFIVAKGETAPIALYRFPAEPRNGTYALEEIASLPGTPRQRDRITDSAVSSDGAVIALRTNSHLMLYRASDLLSGHFLEASRLDLAPAREPQGEGVTFGEDHSLYLVGEGGGESRGGTFARVTCD